MDIKEFLSVGVFDDNKFKVSEYGEVRLTGKATVWDDVLVPLTQTKIGANGKPDFDETNIGYLFPQNDATEILYVIAQMPHKWKEGSTIYPHVHWQQAADANVTWKIDYKWFNIGAAVPAGFTTLALDQLTQTYTSGSIHQLSASANGIAGTGKLLSSILLVKLYRNDNTYTGDALAWDFDIHIEIDSIGSEAVYSKA